MSKNTITSHDSSSSCRAGHAISSLSDPEIFALLDEYYSSKEPEPPLDNLQAAEIELSFEEARLADMIINGLQEGGMSKSAAVLLVALYACNIESRAISQEVTSYVC